LQNMQATNSIDHWRSSADLATDKIENLRLLHKAEVVHRRFAVFLDVRGDDLERIADEKTIGHFAQPIARNLGQQMMGHLFLIKDVLACRGTKAPPTLFNDLPPIGLT